MKKITSLLFAPIIFMMVMSISSCKKYDEGPAFSLNSKKARVVNEWELNKATVNGDDVTSFVGKFMITFKKDNTYKNTFDGYTENGKWEFSSDKEKIILTDSDNYTEVWEIIKLKKDEMWIEFDDSGDNIELQFKTK